MILKNPPDYLEPGRDGLLKVYQSLLSAFGHQHWWPADDQFEIIIGTILAQNVSWTGAYKAVCNLKEAGFLDIGLLHQADPSSIASHIHSSRYYNQKADKISRFMSFFFERFDGDLKKMEDSDTESLRSHLLSLKGFGPETVDSILLYACGKPIFVVDAYTRRIGSRQGWFDEKYSYDQIQQFFMDRLPGDVMLYNDLHAQFVCLGNRICRNRPDCEICPIRSIPEYSRCSFLMGTRT